MMLVKPVIPKEHGAWAVFFVPLFIGAQLGGGFDWFALSFALSSLGVFLSYLSAQTFLHEALRRTQDHEKLIAARQWTAIYLTAGVIFSLPVLVVHERWLLLPIGVASIGCFFLNFFLARRQPKTIPSDLAGVLGVTLTGPSTYYVVSGQLDTTAFVVWLLNILFFGSCVFYVHMRIRALAARKTDWGFQDRFRYGGLNLVYHVVMIAILLLLVLQRLTPSLALLAFAPITMNAVWGTVKLASQTDFRKLGLALLSHSVVFMALLLVLLR
jgi:hypothetical protein